MSTRLVLLCMVSLLLLPTLHGSVNAQSSPLAAEAEYDTASIVIEYVVAYPGLSKRVEVSIRNPEWVAGYSLRLDMAGPADVARFCYDDAHGDCVTEGSPFPWVTCQCLNENCTSVLTEASALGDTLQMIEPNDEFVTLFSICTDACCIPDADTVRSTYINIPWEESELYGRNGDPIPFTVSFGELFVWWSVPGDVNRDRLVDGADIVFLIGYIFRGTAAPCVCEAADCNNDYVVDVGDLMYLINYLFLNGPAPLEGGASCWYEDCWP